MLRLGLVDRRRITDQRVPPKLSGEFMIREVEPDWSTVNFTPAMASVSRDWREEAPCQAGEH